MERVVVWGSLIGGRVSDASGYIVRTMQPNPSTSPDPARVSAPGDSAPEDSAPEDSAPEASAPEDSAPEDSAPEDSAPDDGASRRRGTALCLSGGGYRAALFHLGACRRLDELGILAQVDTVSAVSGGSILANLLGDRRLTYQGAGPRHESHLRVGGFEELVALPLRRLASRNVRTPALLSRLAPRWWGVEDAAVRALADQLAEAVPWWSTPLSESGGPGPTVVTGATDVSYGVGWVFEGPSRRRPTGRVGDYRVGYAAPPAALRLADAVATSCAFPPFFAPMLLDGESMHLAGGHAGLESPEERRRTRRRVRLTDGGVYDNLALEPVWKSHRTVLVSDGGSVFRADTERTVHGRMLRILSIATSGGQSVRTRWLQAAYARQVLSGTFWGLDTQVPSSYPRSTTELIDAVRTDLDAFSVREQQALERHGYLVADAQVHAHAADLIRLHSPARPPHPEVADPDVAARALRGSARRLLLGRR